MPGKRARRLLRFLLSSLLVLVLLVVSVPLWFPWLLRPVAKRFGATFRNYERIGYSGFEVTDAIYTNRNVRVQAGRLRLASLGKNTEAEGWSVIVTPTSRSTTNDSRSVHRTYNKVWRVITNVQHRFPNGAITNGYVQTPKVTVQIPGVRWNGENFSGQAQISNSVPLTTVRAKLPASGPVRVELSSPALQVQSILIASNQSSGLFISSSNSWSTNQFKLFAHFGTNGLLPHTARVEGKSVIVPPAKGDVTLAWEDNAYVLDVMGALLDHPITFAGHIKGNLDSARVEAAEVKTPWASANLQGDVLFARGRILHAGSGLVRNVDIKHLNRFDVAVDWSGEKFNLTNIYATARAGPSTIYAAGTADLRNKRFQVSALEMQTNKLDFTADIHWPATAQVCLQMTNFSPDAFSGFVDLPEQHVVVKHLRASAAWTNGPVTAELDFAGSSVLKDGTRLGAEGALAAGPKGLSLTNLTFTRNAEPVSSAHGFLPVSINQTNNFRITPITNGPLRLQVNADPKAFFWNLLATNFGVALREPEVRADLQGTWAAPVGRVQARAAEIKFRDAGEVPPLDTLALLAHIREDAAEIEFLNFFVTNQPVTFSARMPWPANFWSAPRTNLAKLNWRDLSCRLKIDSAQIAAFAALTPRWIAPQGVIDANVGLEPGGKLTGQLRIDGAGTRPIEALGALQDIEILCRLDDDKAHVHSYIALGGYSVLGAGEVRLDPNRLLRRELPPFEFHLTGENVPLTRQSDAVVRADLDITLSHAPAQPVLISGKLNLRDSLYLRELRDLIPGKLASPDRRPPYFAVGSQPFADWRLDLRASGERFLKVRTPVFNGEVSADVRVFGSLGDPVATGDLLINAGRVRFPFGTIAINQGIVSLTSDNPYRPQLLITGSDRVLGYDINMELTGYADAPVLQFTSTPPLNSDQVLLMLTAGEIPRQGQLAFTAEQRAQKLALFFGRGILADMGIGGGDSNRLTVRSGENVTESGRPTYSVEYELTDDWSVIGQYDQFNDFNLMLKWRVYTR